VLDTIRECDELGRKEFLTKYGFTYARLYPLQHDGKLYDSKAIAGVAVGKQHGEPALPARKFSGGMATVVPVLTKLGFRVLSPVHPATALSIGAIYKRKDLVASYGGQMQGGIWTPREFPAVFIFSGQSGKVYGYADGWSADGVFHNTGEGQTGDMTFTSGNCAIRDHRQDRKELLLFEDLGKG
jgi:5-methylcytosine-specific restriction protein A